MRKIGAYVAIGVLIGVTCSASPSAAFDLRLGPLHFGLPFLGHSFGHRHWPTPHHDIPAGAGIYDTTEPVAPSSAQGAASPLLYPGLALPAIYNDIFSPASLSRWPFGYEAIFRAAFAKAPADHDLAQVPCRQIVRGTAIVERLGRDIRPTAAQRPLLQKLGSALGMASGFLARSCPKELPPQPVARLRLMETQIEELSMALDIIRPPLQQFEQSLNRSQQARLAAALTAPPAAGDSRPDVSTPVCGATPTAIDWSIHQLSQSLQPSDSQRDALADTKAAFARAASNLDPQCPASLPPSPFARLVAIQARLDAEWRAVLTVQVALASLENGLSDDQRVRFNALDFAAR